jgi:hypothetical protein
MDLEINFLTLVVFFDETIFITSGIHGDVWISHPCSAPIADHETMVGVRRNHTVPVRVGLDTFDTALAKLFLDMVQDPRVSSPYTTSPTTSPTIGTMASISSSIHRGIIGDREDRTTTSFSPVKTSTDGDQTWLPWYIFLYPLVSYVHISALLLQVEFGVDEYPTSLFLDQVFGSIGDNCIPNPTTLAKRIDPHIPRTTIWIKVELYDL